MNNAPLRYRALLFTDRSIPRRGCSAVSAAVILLRWRRRLAV